MYILRMVEQENSAPLFTCEELEDFFIMNQSSDIFSNDKCIMEVKEYTFVVIVEYWKKIRETIEVMQIYD